MGCGIYLDGRAALKGVNSQVPRRHDKCLPLNHLRGASQRPKGTDYRESECQYRPPEVANKLIKPTYSGRQIGAKSDLRPTP